MHEQDMWVGIFLIIVVLFVACQLIDYRNARKHWEGVYERNKKMKEEHAKICCNVRFHLRPDECLPIGADPQCNKEGLHSVENCGGSNVNKNSGGVIIMLDLASTEKLNPAGGAGGGGTVKIKPSYEELQEQNQKMRQVLKAISIEPAGGTSNLSLRTRVDMAREAIKGEEKS